MGKIIKVRIADNDHEMYSIVRVGSVYLPIDRNITPLSDLILDDIYEPKQYDIVFCLDDDLTKNFITVNDKKVFDNFSVADLHKISVEQLIREYKNK